MSDRKLTQTQFLGATEAPRSQAEDSLEPATSLGSRAGLAENALEQHSTSARVCRLPP
jgi:hypothetical protein